MRRERETSFSSRCVLLALIALLAVACGAPQPENSSKESANQSSEGDSKSSSSEEGNHSGSKDENASDDLIVRSSDSASKEFLARVPIEKVAAIMKSYYHHDEEVQRAYEFIKTEIFELMELSDVQALVNYLQRFGVDLVDMAQRLAKAPKPDSAENTPDSELDETSIPEEKKGVRGLVDSILGLMSAEKLMKVTEKKVKEEKQLAKSKPGKDLYSTELKSILKKLYHSKPVRDLFYKDEDDIYLPKIYEFIKHSSICPTDTPIEGEYRLKTCVREEEEEEEEEEEAEEKEEEEKEEAKEEEA